MLDSGIESINVQKPETQQQQTLESPKTVKKGEVIMIGFDDNKSLGRNPLIKNPGSIYTMNYDSKSGDLTQN
jgi:hypothetical protein